jgi:L-aspartate oxidase
VWDYLGWAACFDAEFNQFLSPRRSLELLDQFDVLIIGAGAAGLYAALSIDRNQRVGLVTKDTLAESASDWAQGGMAAAIDPNDSPALHASDTLKAGAGLCEPRAVEFLVSHAAEQVQALLEMGIAFDRQGDRLAFTLEAAHSRPRVLHAADTTGRELVSTLTHQVLQRNNITILPESFTLSLWLDPERQTCQGVCLIRQDKICWLRSRIVVLATGGGGQVFAQTTNPTLSTGDGVAIAWRAGAQLRDLEFVQFHPTALTIPGAPRFLISEAVRGEGAHLVDIEGRRFLFDYDPAGELAPRDVVSRAIYLHLLKTQHEHVWLDLRSIPPEKIRHRFPKIMQVCQSRGIDVLDQPIPVAPAAHYWMGGIVTNTQGATSIPGLYAVGEVASTGVHGANRLASNSLLECLVFAAQLAQIELPSLGLPWPPVTVEGQPQPNWSLEQAKIASIRQALPSLIWQSAGICRQADVLQAAIAQVTTWKQEFFNLAISQFIASLQPGQNLALSHTPANQQIRLWSETNNLLDIAELILRSAAFRTESRGSHYRLDYPQPAQAWQAHTLVQNQHWQRSALVEQACCG